MVQLKSFPPIIYLRRIRPENNEHRFYNLILLPNLFGEISLVREWGRVGCTGRMRYDLYPDEPQALNALQRLSQAKLRRGYCQIVDSAHQATASVKCPTGSAVGFTVISI